MVSRLGIRLDLTMMGTDNGIATPDRMAERMAIELPAFPPGRIGSESGPPDSATETNATRWPRSARSSPSPVSLRRGPPPRPRESAEVPGRVAGRGRSSYGTRSPTSPPTNFSSSTTMRSSPRTLLARSEDPAWLPSEPRFKVLGRTGRQSASLEVFVESFSTTSSCGARTT